MPVITITAIAVALAMDAFAVSTVVSVILGAVTRRQVFRIAFHFGLFQALMPVVGYAAGTSIRGYISAWDHWIAFGLLTAIGVKTVVGSVHQGEGERRKPGDPTRGLRLIGLSTAVSVDALAVGLSFAAMGVDIVLPAVITGLVTACLSTIGMFIGSRVGLRFGRGMECLGGVVLIIIGVQILLRHVL